MDESGIHHNEACQYGWSIKGKRLHALKDGNRGKRLNIIGALRNRKVEAPFVFEGSCCKDVFNTYASKILLPILSPSSVLILDNASFHKASNIIKIAESKGCQVQYLPPYSPDLNKIEGYWFGIKNKIRKCIRDGVKDLTSAVEIAFNCANNLE